MFCLLISSYRICRIKTPTLGRAVSCILMKGTVSRWFFLVNRTKLMISRTCGCCHSTERFRGTAGVRFRVAFIAYRTSCDDKKRRINSLNWGVIISFNSRRWGGGGGGGGLSRGGGEGGGRGGGGGGGVGVGGVLPRSGLMGMSRWMGSHFHDCINYYEVVFL